MNLKKYPNKRWVITGATERHRMTTARMAAGAKLVLIAREQAIKATTKRKLKASGRAIHHAADVAKVKKHAAGSRNGEE